MPDNLSDRTVLLAILMALILVFGLIFSTRRPDVERNPPLQWRDAPPTESAEPAKPTTLQI